MKNSRPYKLIDGDEVSVERAIQLMTRFVRDRQVAILNVAGPRATQRPQAYAYARAVISGLLVRTARSSQSG
jgi:hypothetical protein